MVRARDHLIRLEKSGRVVLIALLALSLSAWVQPPAAVALPSSTYVEWATIEINASAPNYQTPSIAVDSGQNAHIAYYHYNETPILMYAYISHAGGRLQETPVESIDYNGFPLASCMIATDSIGKAHMVYSVVGHTHYASNSEGDWQVTNLSASMGAFDSGDIAVDRLGRVHIVAENASHNITHFVRDSGTWISDPIAGCRAEAYAIVVDRQNNTGICFYGYNATDQFGLWYATNSTGTWDVAMVSGPGDDLWFWGRPSIALGQSDEVYIAVSVNPRSSVLGGGSDAALYKRVSGLWRYSDLLSADGYLPARALAVDSTQSVHILINTYHRGAAYPVYHPDYEYGWGFKTPPPFETSCAAMDPQDYMHVVSIPASRYDFRTSISYASNSCQTPSQPLNLTASSVYMDIRLQWSSPNYTGGLAVDGFRIYVSNWSSSPSAGWDRYVDIAPNASTYTFYNLESATKYYFAISASNQLGEGVISMTVNATTSVDLAPPPPSEDELNLWFIVAAGAIIAAVVGFRVWVWRRDKARDRLDGP